MAEKIYYFYGKETYLIDEKIKEIIELLKIDEFNVVKYDLSEEEIDLDIIEELRTVSFFSDLKAIIISNFKTVARKSDTFIKEIISYFESPNEDVVLILTDEEMVLDHKEIKDSIMQHAYIEKIDELKLSDYPNFIQNLVNKYNFTIEEDAILLLLERTNKDLLLIKQEIEKLILFSYENKHIQTSAVNILVSRNLEENIYELTTALIKKDRAKSIEVFYDLMSRLEDPLRIISNILSKIKELMHTKLLLDKNYLKEDIEKHFNISSGRAYYVIKNAKEVSFSLLEKYLDSLQKLDLKIKTGTIDKKIGLEMFLLEV